MFRTKKLSILAIVALLSATFAMPPEADAGRRYRRAVRRAPVVYSRPYVVRRAPVVVAAPYVGYGRHYGYRYGGYGFGGVRVAAPGVGVYVGW